MLNHAIDVWSSLYANHAALRTGVEYLHVGGLVAGGGCAITADLATITAGRDGAASRASQLRLLKHTHGIVVAGLVALLVSGLLLVGADVDTFVSSRVFWLKMGLMVLLLANGLLVLRGERQVELGGKGAWARLHSAAVASLVLWGATTLAGVALSNIG